MNIKIKKLDKDVSIPRYETTGAAGFDIAANESKIVLGGEKAIIKTGLAMEIPVGYELQIRPRSGISAKGWLRISNAPGTIDSDYRGEVAILVDNLGDTPITINKGDRIAQGVLATVIQAGFIEVFEVSHTERGEGGFGSTGTVSHSSATVTK